MNPVQQRVVRLSLLALTFLSQLVAAQENLRPEQNYLVTTWGPNEGLPGNSITDVAQTPEGYIWAGTLLSGLVRFDGVRFVAYSVRNIPQFRGISIRKLMVDRAGVLWASAYNGALMTWNPEHGFTLIETNAGRMESLLWSQSGHAIFSMGENHIYEVLRTSDGWRGKVVDLPGSDFRLPPCADSEGHVWWLRNQREIVRWHDQKFETLALPPGLDNRRLLALTSDQSGNVWAGTDGAVLKWEGDRFANATPTNVKLTTVKFLVSAGNSLWVNDDEHLRRLVNGQWVAEAKGWNEDYSKKKFSILRGDSKGGLWLANDETGLIHVLPDGTVHKISVNDGLPSNVIGNIFVDREGTAWIGYQRGALIQVRPRLFKAISRAQGLKESLVNSVCEDADGAVWIGTAGNVCARYQDGHCLNFSLPANPTAHDTVLAVDFQNRIWASGRGCGLLMFTNGQFIPVLGPEKFPGGVRLLLPARDGRLWVGALSDIFVVSEGSLRKVYHADGSTARPTALAETTDGAIWAGISAGALLRWSGAEFTNVTQPELKSLSLGRFCSLCPTSDGGLWVGTSEGGLLRFQDGKFRRLSTQNGLRSDRIAQVQLDRRGNLWLATETGIERVEASALAHFEKGDMDTVPVSKYGRNDGIENVAASIEFQPNCWSGRDGTLWFAMGNNIAYVDSERVNASSLPPTVVLEEFSMDQKVVWPGNPAGVLAPNDMASDEEIAAEIPKVVIPPGLHDLEFRYTGLSRSGSPLLQFKYRLAGIQTDWHDANIERVARYNYLPPGKYIFQVRAGNSDDVWGETSAALQVELQPFFYQTIWFRWAVGLALTASIGLVVWKVSRRRMRQKLARLAQQNEIERDRIRIARDMHDEIGSKLARISYISELVRENEAHSGTASAQINAIAETSRDVLQSLDEIVWAVNPHNDTLQHLAAYLSQYAHDYFQSTSVNCAVKMPMNLPQHPVSSETRHNLFLAFEESLTNVLKHAAARNVEIQMELKPTVFEILITDDGRGLQNAAKSGDGSASLNANGLVNMRSRLTNIGGEWKIDDAPGKGTRVRLTIPVKLPEPNNL